jgi:PAS domain S-box-containing protein
MDSAERDERFDQAASEALLHAVLEAAVDAIISIDEQGIIQLVNPAAARIFRCSVDDLIGRHVSVLMAPPYGDEHNQYLQRYLATGEKKIIGIGREVIGLRKDGTSFPLDLSVAEARLGEGRVFVGIIRDVSRRKELERDVVETAAREQRRIGQDLHDSVGQELTALNLLAGDLAELVRTDPTGSEKLIERMRQGLQCAQKGLQTVMRGLLPVAVDAAGLMAALADLARRIQQEGKATCAFECARPVSVADNLTATHLFLIAQEAARNALKHARPRSIRIDLEMRNRLLILRVQDDGIGIPMTPAETEGLGLRIMRDRASIIGAKFTIGPAVPQGSLVTVELATVELATAELATNDNER